MKIVIKGKCISKDNEKCFNRAGRPFLSAKYRKWGKDVSQQAIVQLGAFKPILGPLCVHFAFYMPDKRHCDLTNLPKGLCDALNGIVWEDDKQIQISHSMIIYDKQNPRTEIRVTSLLAEEGIKKSSKK